MADKTNNAGIDYGNGISNINLKTGVRYGVISIHEVLQAWADDSEGDYGEIMCQECLQVVTFEDKICPNENCKHNLIDDFDNIEPASFIYNQEGYQAEQTMDSMDIFITMSPYYTYAAFCSPCAPGAVYLMSPIDKADNNKGYCFGHAWFESSIAPYPVYSIETDKLVNPA